MTTLRTSRLNAAIMAALVGFATTAGTAQAQTVERTGTGQALIFPYYTVNDGWITTINVTNTSESTLAVKFRLRESKNSRDVLDFNVVFSPNDVWTAWLQEDPLTGQTQIFTNDNSCTSPTKDKINGALANPIAYSGSQADGGGSGVGRLRDGYVEMLVMGEQPATMTLPFGGYAEGTVPYNAWHVNGVPVDCAAVDNDFRATVFWDQQSDLTGGTGQPEAAADFAAPTTNGLKGNIAWLKVGTGAGAGSTALAVSDWAQGNLVTAQEFPWFLEPTVITNNTPWQINLPALTAFEDAINVSSAFNEWAAKEPAAVTDWVITFPTKAYHVDQFNESIQAAVNKYRNGTNDVVSCTDAAGNPSDALADRGTCTDLNVVPLAPFTNLFSVETDGVEPLGDSSVRVTYTFFDREEEGVETATGETGISPAPPPELQDAAIRYEANVIQFGSSSILGSSKAAIIDDTLLPAGAVNGWGKVTFGTATNPLSLPAVGFAVKARDQGEPASAYGQVMDHGYTLPQPVTVP